MTPVLYGVALASLHAVNQLIIAPAVLTRTRRRAVR